MQKKWKSWDFDECPKCYGHLEYFTNAKIGGEMSDGESVRCVDCDFNAVLRCDGDDIWTETRIYTAGEAVRECEKIAMTVVAPKSIGKQQGTHHNAGAQHAARLIRNRFPQYFEEGK